MKKNRYTFPFYTKFSLFNQSHYFFQGPEPITNGTKPYHYDVTASRESSPHHTFRPRSPAPITNGHVGKMNGHSPQDLSHRGPETFQAIDFSRNRVTTNDNPIQPQAYRFNVNGTTAPLENGFLPSTSAPATSSVSTLVNNIQQQRLLQNSPSASYILQTFLRNNFERAAAMQFGNGNCFGTSVDSKPDSILASTLNDFR